MRVDLARDYLHHRYQITVAIPDDELQAMDPTAYELVRRTAKMAFASEPISPRDMVAILQIAAEWLQRHPEAQYSPEPEEIVDAGPASIPGMRFLYPEEEAGADDLPRRSWVQRIFRR
jgi:hypothetical protein